MKRIFDFLGRLFLLLALSPVLLLIAMVVRTTLGSPVLFKQKRPGLYGKPFYIYKFRTMSNEKDIAGKWLPDEERLTPLGGFLRRFSMDELPELLNVLKLPRPGTRPDTISTAR